MYEFIGEAYYIFIQLIVVAALCAFVFTPLERLYNRKKLFKKVKHRKTRYRDYYQYKENEDPERLTYSTKEILTPTEKEFYIFLKKECAKRDMIVFPKMKPEQFALITYSAYPVDFVLCNSDFQIVAGMELEGNGSNHQKEDAIEQFFWKLHLPIFRVKADKEIYTEQVINILNFLHEKYIS